ncbi:MAG: helix-turn-helix transcriptional regulator [Anaerolineae bacterium]|nr:helix-turn-helix transcriptional regulator [Anaerolineae bacterium]
MNAIDAKGKYQPRKVVGEMLDHKTGEKKIVHSPRGRSLRILKNMDTPALRLNRVAAVLIGERIRELRISREMTLEELATTAGLSSQTPRSYMWSIENAQRGQGIRLGTLFAIAAALDCKIDELLPSTGQVLKSAAAEFETFVRLK